jgi:hypothetical protein
MVKQTKSWTTVAVPYLFAFGLNALSPNDYPAPSVISVLVGSLKTRLTSPD